MGRMIEKTPDILRQLVLEMQDRIAQLEGRGAADFQGVRLNEAQRRVKYAQLDFQSEKYGESYQNMRDAQEIIGEIDAHMDEREFDAQVNQIVGEFATQLRGFRSVLDVGAAVMLQLVVSYTGHSRAVAMMEATSPTDLRQSIADLQSRARRLTTPPARTSQQAALIDMLSQAELASTNFEKMLILDQYNRDDARDIVLTAYTQMKKAQDQMYEIQHSIQYPRERFEPRGVEKVASSSLRGI
jgi:hypothetical protein